MFTDNRSRRWILTSVLLTLLALPAGAADPVIYNGIDVWTTGDEGKTFFDFSFDPIPQGFFCSGSPAFTGKVVFQGKPIATSPPGALGDSDTIVQRLDDAVFDEKGIAYTRIQLKALSFVSIQPIVTRCGQYDVAVALDGVQAITEMKIVRDNPEGGRFLAPVSVRSRVTFTPREGASGERLEVIRSATFPAYQKAYWASRAGDPSRSYKHRGLLLVDTDGDGEPDTNLPGTANFAVGWRASLEINPSIEPISEISPIEHCDNEGCHCMMCAL